MRRILLATTLLVSAAAAKTFTLEQVLSAPFPSELIAAPGGGKVAWLLNERGARNVWMAAAPDYKGVRLTAYTEDDGQDIGQLHWTPDGRALVYVRGGDLEFLGRPDPNPSTNPGGVEQAIWTVAPGEKPRKIADGHSPAISPKGDRVAFLQAGQIWLAPLAGADKPALLYHGRTGVTSSEMEWSPDGSRLAFVSDRGNHSFIAVYNLTGKTLTYLDPSVDRDRDPVWSPDGKQVAFLRNPASGAGGGGRGGRGGGAAGDSWSIRVATVADGTGRQIWMADRGTGSAFHPMVAERQLSWSAGDRLVFPWEKDGWLHLYSVAVEGGAPALLTPGAFEVEFVSFSQDGKEMVFASNQDDIDRRHIWRVSTASGPPRAVTSGEGLEWAPALAGNAVAFLHADGRQPARAAIQVSGRAVRDLAPDSVPADFPADSLVVPQQVIYTASDGMAIHGQLFLPPDSRPGQRHPALVFMHGGSRRQMLLGWHYM
ncbi:MAG: DPP IV N-terminal domain-containing protein, partial [Acidobacteriia bacterium]|nr:DPP IV N-terminal domain-containing protein [Terriglobia bacterium]